ncbi:uncharacterized protein DUF326 [Marinisporobacter balticus]|uniref:Uncharacterized protein DUF326 n=2 Tax=Marinisporobacter balticus TaxID=2018667 RepID=A0A4R2KVU9_9FIRM|nr:uncharacterized protein DUF326 [Marinisporobacter balticus]
MTNIKFVNKIYRFREVKGKWVLLEMLIIKNMQSCIDACKECLQACEECFTLCLREADVKSRVNCIEMLRDCVDICELAIGYMSRGSKYAQDICNTCATICDACAKDCEMFQDAHCKKCAEICRRCADECRKMNMAMV